MTATGPNPSVADTNRKPVNLLCTSVILAAGILYPYLYGIWAGPVKPSWFVSALLSSILLWFYWRGFGWARYVTLLAQAVTIADSISALNGHPHLMTIANLGAGKPNRPGLPNSCKRLRFRMASHAAGPAIFQR